LKFALVNPNWNFKGSTYFGCPDAHVPLELLFAHDQVLAAGHEALVVDADGAWLGIDNNFGPRADGEKRPVVYRFAAPAGGWSAQP